MEEIQNYILAVCSILIAVVAVYSAFRLFRDFSLKSPRVRAMRTSFVIILVSTGIWTMHLLGNLSLQGYGQAEGNPLFPLMIYGLTIIIVLFLFYRLRILQVERDQLKELAYKDALTGLLNKNGMDHFWDHCKENEQLAVLFLDLNRFKAINDNLGHHVGDLLLQAVGGKLSQFSSKGKRHIFRVGGDEFVIIAKHYSQKEAEQLALRVLEKTTTQYQLEQHNLFVSASIGITMSHGKVERSRLLKEADTAMYSAKQLGTGRYSVYKTPTSGSYARWFDNFKSR
ncbi:diguanylate cyclase domain-containing protein [Paenibacillus monticola]|uniref:Diguanylate cyclase n=1 Tax=Paenibacillus monticola TaxID=2666075 RepID=A0A7X2H175_9BACL|nr:diguanylate cyclase [Paenibacillus monticola]MRN51689.1 diguanylate cyclase [Paenibacillus monticola]